MNAVRAYPNRTIQVTVRVAMSLSEWNQALQETKVGISDIVLRIFTRKPTDAVETKFVMAEELFLEHRRISQGIDVHIHIDFRGVPLTAGQLEESAAMVLAETFNGGDFCYLLTINHDVSLILPRTPARQEHREREFADTMRYPS